MRKLAEEIANGALRNIGVVEEGGNNKGKWIEHYLNSVGLDTPNPWCAAFVYYRYKKAAEKTGLKLKDFPVSGYTPDFAKWAKDNKRFVLASDAEDKIVCRPEKGDLVLFYFKSKGRIAHIGIVVKSDPRGCWVVAGNTSSDDENDNKTREGDGVYNKFYSYDSFGEFGGFVIMDDPIVPVKKEGIDTKSL